MLKLISGLGLIVLTCLSANAQKIEFGLSVNLGRSFSAKPEQSDVYVNSGSTLAGAELPIRIGLPRNLSLTTGIGMQWKSHRLLIVATGHPQLQVAGTVRQGLKYSALQIPLHLGYDFNFKNDSRLTVLAGVNIVRYETVEFSGGNRQWTFSSGGNAEYEVTPQYAFERFRGEELVLGLNYAIPAGSRGLHCFFLVYEHSLVKTPAWGVDIEFMNASVQHKESIRESVNLQCLKIGYGFRLSIPKRS